ncbi:hypothetical protein H4R99_002590 [Coemansia sp. RSA 1722]|nr:hypothetical protein IWW45_002661 [Coemansia sp. RSA 485]KAJ2602737.1 hypothetical protein H4R99_002590 [Coemansia sp. RSA 1722]
MVSESSTESKSPLGGRYVALLRRTATGVLFSDPIFVAQGQSLPELPEGLHYIVIHPSSTVPSVTTGPQPAKPAAAGTTGKSLTMNAYLPAKDTKHRVQYASEKIYQSEAVLPVLEDYGQFSSFLPTRDSLRSTLPSTYYVAPYSYEVDADEVEANGEPEEKCLSSNDLDSAICAAEKILGSSDEHTESLVSPELLSDLGLTPADLEIEQSHTAPAGSVVNQKPETAESVLRENDKLLTRLLELQDHRAASSSFEQIGREERAIANQLQINLARVAAVQSPSALRPSIDSIHSAAALLLAKDQGSYSGTLPPQRRYAFISNAAANAGFPQGATMAPMQRKAQGTAK